MWNSVKECPLAEGELSLGWAVEVEETREFLGYGGIKVRVMS